MSVGAYPGAAPARTVLLRGNLPSKGPRNNELGQYADPIVSKRMPVFEMHAAPIWPDNAVVFALH